MAFTESVRSFHVPATAGTTAWPPSLPSVPTSRMTRVTSEANDRSWYHGIDSLFQLENFSPHVYRDFSRKIPARYGCSHFCNVADLPGQITSHQIYGVGEVFPGAGHTRNLSLTAELSVRTHFTRHTRDFSGEHAQLLDHGIDNVG